MADEQPHRARIPPLPEGISRPLWSVMIPTYNCALYLRETLVSVLPQDPGAEIMQIEVVDDCSDKDNPAAVVEELGHGRVQFYRQPRNQGYIRNFETCLHRARGRLIHLLHGDDYVRAGFYGRLQQAFEANPDIGAAFCRTIYLDEQGHWLSISRLEQPNSGVLTNWLQKIAGGQRVTTPAVVVRREVYENLGGFDRRLSCAGEDWEMWIRIATRYPFWFEVEPLAAYRVKRAGSLTAGSSPTGELARDMRKATEIVESYLPDYLPAPLACKLTNQARAMYALWALEVVQQMPTKGNLGSFVAQLAEVIRCSHSWKIICLLIFFLVRKGASGSRSVVRTRVALLGGVVARFRTMTSGPRRPPRRARLPSRRSVSTSGPS